MLDSLWRVRTAPLQDVDPQRRLVLVKHEPREVAVHPAVLASPAGLSEGVGQPGAKLQAEIVYNKGLADKFQVSGLNRLLSNRTSQDEKKYIAARVVVFHFCVSLRTCIQHADGVEYNTSWPDGEK